MNQALEDQAVGRVHRMGQKRKVTIRRFIMADSIEARLRAMAVHATQPDRGDAGSNADGAKAAPSAAAATVASSSSSAEQRAEMAQAKRFEPTAAKPAAGGSGDAPSDKVVDLRFGFATTQTMAGSVVSDKQLLRLEEFNQLFDPAKGLELPEPEPLPEPAQEPAQEPVLQSPQAELQPRRAAASASRARVSGGKRKAASSTAAAVARPQAGDDAGRGAGGSASGQPEKKKAKAKAQQKTKKTKKTKKKRSLSDRADAAAAAAAFAGAAAGADADAAGFDPQPQSPKRLKAVPGGRRWVLFDGTWYKATIINVAPASVQVQYDSDGSKEKIPHEDLASRFRTHHEGRALEQPQQAAGTQGFGSDAELQWVQCDSARCGKWRRIPAAVEITDAQRWVCSMNAWDRERASCAAAEEDYGEEA